jgi:hypothetical protein
MMRGCVSWNYLVGFLGVIGEGESVAVRLLENLDVYLAKVRAGVLSLRTLGR